MPKVCARFGALAALSMAAVATTATGATSSSFATQFPSRVLTAQNIERARAGMQPMAWDD